jgi:chromosome segregation ATPase
MAKKTDKKKEAEETYTSADLKRYIGGLMEENREQIKGISEQFIDFRRTLDLNTEMLEAHENRFDTIDQRLYSIDRRFDTIDQKFDTIDQKFDTIDQKLDSHTEMIGVLAKDMVIVKEKVTSIEDNLKKKVDRGEFIALEHRVSSVEVKVG